MHKKTSMPDEGRIQAIAWDDGCANDPVRKGFIIPEITKIFSGARPKRILDLGSGTGYIARKVDRALSYRPEWVLADFDKYRLELAAERAPREMRLNALHSSASDQIPIANAYDAVLMIFTLLEAVDPTTVISYATGSLKKQGLLVIAMPDAWVDIIDISTPSSHLATQFLNQTVEIPKIDKFTCQPYPFFAMRTESLISLVLSDDFSLESLVRGGPRNDVFLLSFRKNAHTAAAASSA